MRHSKTEAGWLDGWLLAGLILVFYVITLAPTVLWGDGAHFQRTASQAYWMPMAAAARLVPGQRLFLHLPGERLA